VVRRVKILAVDQARHGAWAIYDYEVKKLLDYGTWGFDSKNYTFEQAILHIEALLSEVIRTHDIDAVFLEDIQLRKNVQSFKKLAQLQGVLVNMCEKTNILYNLVAPTQWQNYCKARGRTTKEIKSKITSVEPTGKKTSKILSLQAARDIYGIVTENDNLADAVMIGHYVVNNIKIGSEDDFNEKERDD
jgi:Holliday junction resolvasome RuvABC endonuclease subunit